MKRLIVILAAALATGFLGAQPVKPDARYKPYVKSNETLRGKLGSVGSDTMNNLMTYWAEGFRKHYPGVVVSVEGKGSSTAPPALIEGTAQFGPMSRAMKGSEMDAFQKKYGFKPTQLRTSIDGIAVWVHKDNPVQGLTLPQVDALFSKTRKLGWPRQVKTWGDVVKDAGALAKMPPSLYGRNSASGTYGFFKDEALGKGDFRDEVKEQPGSASVVQGVGGDRGSVGYSGIGYKTSQVRAVSLAKKDGEPFLPPTPENVISMKYPLSRHLYLYISKDPKKPLDPVVREFIKYIFSKDGQDVVIKDGYFPVPYETAQEELAKIK